MKRLVVSLILGLVPIAHALAQAIDFGEEIPFVPTPVEVVDEMLKLAAIKKTDALYDLGSGDGRIVIRTATLYGIRAKHSLFAENNELAQDLSPPRDRQTNYAQSIFSRLAQKDVRIRRFLRIEGGIDEPYIALFAVPVLNVRMRHAPS